MPYYHRCNLIILVALVLVLMNMFPMNSAIFGFMVSELSPENGVSGLQGENVIERSSSYDDTITYSYEGDDDFSSENLSRESSDSIQMDAAENIFRKFSSSHKVQQYSTMMPSNMPTGFPTRLPTGSPSDIPSFPPTDIPTKLPISNPSGKPTGTPSDIPSDLPTALPSGMPTDIPTSIPTRIPIDFPTSLPSGHPSYLRTAIPTTEPSLSPTRDPSTTPSTNPSWSPTPIPSAPTDEPSAAPRAPPTLAPSREFPFIYTVYLCKLFGDETLLSMGIKCGYSDICSAAVVGPRSLRAVFADGSRLDSTNMLSGIPSNIVNDDYESGNQFQQTDSTIASKASVHPGDTAFSLSNTTAPSCPKELWQSHLGLVRPGHNLAILQNMSLNDCKLFCLQQSYEYVNFSGSHDFTGNCVLHFNLFTVSVSDRFFDECVDLTVLASNAKCDSIEFQVQDLSTHVGLCRVKYFRDVTANLKDNDVSTYDYSCNTKTPTLAPTVLIPGTLRCDSSNFLRSVSLSSKSLAGYLPATIDIPSLLHLDLSGNEYIGSLPYTILQESHKINTINLASNKLTGMIPSSFCAISNLNELKLSGNSFLCYDECYLHSTIETDFIDEYPVCSSLVTSGYIASYSKNVYSQGKCAYTNSPATPTWMNIDYCSFYYQDPLSTTDISIYHSNSGLRRPPTCLQSSPFTFCHTFSLLSLGCGARSGSTDDYILNAVDRRQLIDRSPVEYDLSMTSDTYQDVDSLETKCVHSFLNSSDSLTSIKQSFVFGLKNVDYDWLYSHLQDKANTNKLYSLISSVMSQASGIPFSSFSITGITLIKPTGVGRILGIRKTTATVSVQIDTFAEGFGSTCSSARVAVDLISSIITGCISPVSSSIQGSFMIALLNRIGGSKSITDDQYLDSFVTSTTTTSGLRFSSDLVISCIRTHTPTAQPTPSRSPTVPPTTTPSATPTSTPTQSPTHIKKCINLELVDLYGDGWGSARLMLITNSGRQEELYPKCGNNPRRSQFCFNEDTSRDGDYVVVKVIGLEPINSWEIYWRVTEVSGNTTYSGGYRSSITYTYYEKSTWSTKNHLPQHVNKAWLKVTQSERLLQDDTERICSACVVAPRKPVKKVISPERIYDQTDDGHFSNTMISSNYTIYHISATATKISSEAIGAGIDMMDGREIALSYFPEASPKYPSSSISTTTSRSRELILDERKSGEIRQLHSNYDLSYSLEAPSGSWYSADGLSAKFYLSNDAGDLMMSGTLCSPSSLISSVHSYCDMGLKDGRYSWRVTGALSANKEDIKWHFCGVTGGAGTELLLELSGGRCSPVALKTVSSLCSSGDSAVSLSEAPVSLTVHGVIALGGLPSGPVLSLEETNLLRNVIVQELNDAKLGPQIISDNDGQVFIRTTDSVVTSRSLDAANMSHEVMFKVVAKALKLDVENLREYLEASMSSGLFLTRIRARSFGSDSMRLQSITRVSLLDLHIIHETRENKEFSLLASMTVSIWIIVGLIFSVLLTSSYINRRAAEGYSKLGMTAPDLIGFGDTTL